MRTALLSLLVLTGCSSMEKRLQDGETVQHVDIPRFMGAWYVIANVPLYPEKNATNAIEKYTWNAEKERIDVDYSHHEKTPGGELKKYPQKAWIANQMSRAEWRVQPFWPLKFAYLVVMVADDYSWTVIGVPNKKHVWIMSRTSSMEPGLYDRLVREVAARGYDLKDLRKVPQVW